MDVRWNCVNRHFIGEILFFHSCSCHNWRHDGIWLGIIVLLVICVLCGCFVCYTFHSFKDHLRTGTNWKKKHTNKLQLSSWQIINQPKKLFLAQLFRKFESYYYHAKNIELLILSWKFYSEVFCLANPCSISVSDSLISRNSETFYHLKIYI